ncbi:MAG: hypothetical protein NTY75_00415 [Candidatus Shapirobacteria bacterium]|nr:hypothetical protein [Candidatus Shapirobacteria bacterium]
MARIKLAELRQEITRYIGVPYFSNIHHLAADNVLVGKGTAKEIALITVELANLENIKLLELSPQQIYDFQKKHGLGIDCSGLACQLLNFYQDAHLDVRKTSADMLTSPPLSKPISDIQTGDLIRQKNGYHVLFVIEKIGDKIIYVDSSHSGRGVHYGEINLPEDQNKISQGVFRLI